MRKKQIQQKIAHLMEAGVEITEEKEVSIYLRSNGEFDDETTRTKAEEIAEALGWHGFRCASGEWLFRQHYHDRGDPSAVWSDWHYF